MTSVSTPFLIPDEGKSKAGAEGELERRKFTAEEGDHLTLLNVYNAFVNPRVGRQSARWCVQHRLNFRALSRAISIRGQLEKYMRRLQKYCPMSTAVWLAAGTYIFRLCVEDRLVPCTARTVHRLVLGSLRVAMKALEDLRYPQDRFAGVGGVRDTELHFLEIAICYLTDFDLQVSNDRLYRKMLAFQQAAFQASLISRQIPANEMKLRIPMRTNASAQTA